MADELVGRVLLEADEEQAGVELAGGRVHAVDEAVAPPQQGRPVVGGRGRHPDVGALGDAGLAEAVEGGQVERVVLVGPSPSGAPLSFARPMVRSWSPSVLRSHASRWTRIRRATR